MAARDIRAGGAFVELMLRDSRFARGLKRAGRRLQDFGRSATMVGKTVMATGLVMAAAFVQPIKAASDLQETMNKFNVVFGDQSKRVKAWGDEFANQVGRSQKQIVDFLASSQDLFVPLGFEPGAAEEMSKEITGLAIDLASFNNMQDADTLRDLQAALTGSGEVMKKYGVIVSEAAVKQELMAQGMSKKAAAAATDQQKVQARLNIIMRGTTAAQGDAVRSAGSFANQVKALKGRLTDLAGTVGNALLPSVTKYVTLAVEAVGRIKAFAEQNGDLIRKIAMVAVGVTAVGGALTALGVAATGVGIVVGGLAGAISAAGAVLGAILSPIGLVVAAIGGFVAMIATSEAASNAFWVTIEATWGAIKSLATSVWGTVGGVVVGTWERITEAASTALSWLRDTTIDVFSRITFTVNNWQLMVAKAFVGAQLSIVQFGGEVKHLFGAVIPTWLSWFFDNWRDVFTDVMNITKTVVMNMHDNLFRFFTAVINWMRGDGFDFEWTALTDGFESAIKELPTIAEREIGALEKSLSREFANLADQLDREWEQHQRNFASKIAGGGVDGAAGRAARAAAGAAGRAAVGAASGAAETVREKTQKARDAAINISKQDSRREIFATFSAAAAIAVGQGGTGAENQIKQLRREQKDQQGKLLRAVKKGGAMRP